MGIFDRKKDPFSFIEEIAAKRRKRKGSKTENLESADKTLAPGISDQGKDIHSSIKELAAAQRAKNLEHEKGQFDWLDGPPKKKASEIKNPEPVDKAPASGSASLELGALKSAPYSLPNISDKKLLTLH